MCEQMGSEQQAWSSKVTAVRASGKIASMDACLTMPCREAYMNLRPYIIDREAAFKPNPSFFDAPHDKWDMQLYKLSLR